MGAVDAPIPLCWVLLLACTVIGITGVGYLWWVNRFGVLSPFGLYCCNNVLYNASLPIEVLGYGFIYKAGHGLLHMLSEVVEGRNMLLVDLG